MSIVSLRQIAERVGCSRSTVSYALRNSPNISKELRDKIQRVAEEFGWRPDPELARQMALVRQTLIKTDLPHLAIVINKSRKDLLVEHAPELHLRGAKEYAEKMGYRADVFNLAEQPLSPKRLRNILVARGIQGIIFIATIHPELSESYLNIGQEFACVIAGVRFPNIPFHVVVNDYLGAGNLAIHKMHEAGHRKIGLILPRGVDTPLGYSYSAGFYCGSMEVPAIELLPILHVGKDETNIPDYEIKRVKQWILDHRPDAIITTDPLEGIQIQQDTAREGLRFSLYSADFFPGQEVQGGINMRQRRIGEAAVDIVVAQLHRGTYGLPEVQRNIHIGAVWVAGTPVAKSLPVSA